VRLLWVLTGFVSGYFERRGFRVKANRGSLTHFALLVDKERRVDFGFEVGLAFEDGFEVFEGAGVFGLAEPEDGFLADDGVGVGVGYVHELGDAFVFGELA
jgi:hypothetical protein